MDQQQQDERDGATATRSQHVVYTLAHDWGVIPQFLAPALERIDRGAAGTQLLVVTPDAETAVAVADAALTLHPETGARPLVVPVTRAERVTRLARAGAPAVIAGPPDALAALVRAAALKLDAVRAVIFAWADEIAASPAAAELETVLAELPKDAARVLVAAEPTDAVEALIERYLRRPRRVAPPAAAPKAVSLSYIAIAPAARPAALRRLLDELDPPSAAVLVTNDASEAEALRTLRALGYPAPIGEPPADDATSAFGPDVRVTRGDAPDNVALLVLYDVPTDRAVLDRATAAKPAHVVAFAQPRQLDALRAIAGGPTMPLALPDLARGARSRDDALRAELRAVLDAGVPHRELLALEPLLDAYDGVQLAAAAVKLLEQARAAGAAAPRAAAGGSAGAGAEPGAMTRLFITVGGKDGVRPGDLVGAIAGEAGITSDRIGKIEVRDAFSLVEVASADAARVIEKVNGIAIRGRRAMVREERERPGGGRDAKGGPRGGERGERRAPAGDRRGGERRGPGAGGARGFDARREGPRGFGERDDRGVRERAEQRDEWAERAARMRNARRDRPEAGGAPDDGGESTEG